MRGTVKTLTDKGFGFIHMGAGNKDLFFHSNSLGGVAFSELQQGDELEFDVDEGPKGAFASNIEKCD